MWTLESNGAAPAWDAQRSTRLVDFRFPSGRPMMTIDHHPATGYRVAAPGYGAHVVAGDGRSIVSALPAGAPWRWQRLAAAQVLPLAASLRGKAAFHASAVTIGGRAFAFSARSGTGKTTLALNLVGRGALLVTDDVLAIETVDGGVVAHAGARLVNVDPAVLRSLSPAARGRVGRRAGRGAKIQLVADLPSQPLTLGGLCLLRRTRRADVLVERAPAPDPRELLATAFLSYVRSAPHLSALLDACARLGDQVPVYRVELPDGMPAADAAARVEERLAEASGA